MKTIIFLILMCFTVTISYSQLLFNHITERNTFNRDTSISYLQNDRVHENPNAIIFVYPYWQDSDDYNPSYTYCLDFSTRKWGIRYAAAYFRGHEKIRFSVLAFNQENSYAFQYVAKSEKIANWSYNNILTIDDVRTNNKKNISLIVTQVTNRDLRNPNEIAVQYDSTIHKWQIVNLSGDSIKVGYTFNILIANYLSSNYKQDLFEHTVKPHCKHTGYTTLNRSSLNGYPKHSIFATQVLKCNGGTNQLQSVWFDNPSDNYRDYDENHWLLYNTANGFNVYFSHNAKFNILVTPKP